VKQWLPFESYTGLVATNQMLLRRIFYGFALLVLLWTYISHSFLSQVGNNPLLFQDIDPTYWLFMILDLPTLFSGSGAYILDGLLITSCIGSLLLPKQTITCWVFFISHFIYFVQFNLLSGHHYMHVGILFLSFPFVFSSTQRFTAAFTFCRFLFCQMMLFAAIWKIGRGNLTHMEQGSTLLLQQYKSALVNTGSFRNDILLFFIQHKLWGQALWVAVVALEAVFLLGFLTWRKDQLLLISYLLFFTGGWFFFDIYSVKNLILLLTLGPVLQSIDYLRLKVLREKQQPITASNMVTGLPLRNERSRYQE
jgi:hypothetical protein